jgi:hypothetical protein
MNWFEIIKADEGKHGKHLTKVYAFLKRFFGNPPDKTPTTFEYHGELKITPSFNFNRTSNFDKYYITIDEIYENQDVEKFVRRLRDLGECFDFDKIYEEFKSEDEHYQRFNNIDPIEVIPGFFLSATMATFTVTFNDNRHIQIRDFLYEQNNPAHYQRFWGDKKYKPKEELVEELKDREKHSWWRNYEKQKRLERGHYGKFDDCLQGYYKSLDDYLKLSNNFWYQGQRTRRDMMR